MTKYIISKPDTGPIAELILNDDEMIVYDVCKIKDYEGGDYVSRKARNMDYVVQPIGQQGEEDDGKSGEN